MKNVNFWKGSEKTKTKDPKTNENYRPCFMKRMNNDNNICGSCTMRKPAKRSFDVCQLKVVFLEFDRQFFSRLIAIIIISIMNAANCGVHTMSNFSTCKFTRYLAFNTIESNPLVSVCVCVPHRLWNLMKCKQRLVQHPNVNWSAFISNQFL